MTFAQLIGYGVLTIAVWKLAQRRAYRKANALDVAGPEKEHWWKGNVESMFVDGFQRCLDIAAEYGGAVKVHALFGDKWLYVSDPRALHHILVKEQHIFEENDSFLECNKLIFGDGLISTLGEQHRKQRKMLNPVFSTSNMRELLPIIQTISHQLKSILVSNLSAGNEHDHASCRESVELDLLPWLSRSSLDCICEGVLGYHSAALDTRKEDEYTDALRMLSSSITKSLIFRPFVPMVVRKFSLYWRKKIADWLTMSWWPTENMRNLRELRHIVEIMDSASRAIFQEKKAALQPQLPSPLQQAHDTSGGTRGKDMMSIMLRANTSSSEADRLSDTELLGQMNVMIFAGLETTTVAVARALYMLAKHPDIQEQLRTEICGAMAAHDVDRSHTKDENGYARLSYDVLMNLPFLNAVVRETLRVYPSLPILTRRTTESASVPLQFPVRSASGKEIDTIHLAKDQRIIISIIAANHNQAVWGEDASEWKPDRWLKSPQGVTPGNKDAVKYPGIYSSMMTFLAGNRSCIGLKFAEMEIKDVLATLLPVIHFALPSEPDDNGNVKEIHWKMSGFHTPVIKAPAGDGETPLLPLSMRLVRD
ncbi:cytochrome P450 [Suillus bovinus]|uniref:cytochrome P450 n=1 Tax=Suillus bovinus TaxID=48563 RepID=UPI001B86663C|nr:cytochrome P450 [Suillus bovinus]KAG2146016.1 cytochrome P450 [Suillus bovinus]